MTKKEYIASLTIEQLRALVEEFSEMLLDQEMVNYIGEDEDEDCGPYEPGFTCAHTGDRYGI